MKRLRGGDPRARLAQRVERDGECLLWTGAVDSSGYGSFWLSGRVVGAHRAAYALHVGPIPEGYDIDHLCHRPLCVEPSHLAATTPSANRSRTLMAARTECVNGHPFTEENVRNSPGRGRVCRACDRARHSKAKESA